jgi:hypothetical protein
MAALAMAASVNFFERECISDAPLEKGFRRPSGGNGHAHVPAPAKD